MCISVEHDSGSSNDREAIDDELASPDSINSGIVGGIDALNEELDYDESMDDIEQYLREDDDDNGQTHSL